MAEKINNATLSYGFGILSIVFAFFTPVAGLIIGIIGFRKSKQAKLESARKLNIIGIVISVVLLIVSLGLLAYSISQGLNPTNFPI